VIEIALGMIVVAATVPILISTGDTLLIPAGDLFQIVGMSGTAAIAAIGLILITHGLYRRAIHRHPERQKLLRTTALVSVSTGFILFLALIAPQSVEVLNTVQISGFPLGYYLAAQGLLIALAAVTFIHAGRQMTIDDEPSSMDQRD
jgi:putative solute:sodium symporter small subunit